MGTKWAQPGRTSMPERWKSGYKPEPNPDGLDPFRPIAADELLAVLTDKQRFVVELWLGIRDGRKPHSTAYDVPSFM